ncbi:MAG: metal ABC transporter ATP-binding protein [Planctomycetota bacterium]
MDATLSSHAIETRNLTVTYGAEPVLWNVDAQIPHRGMTGIIGPNGAGKSTLIKAILGIVPIAAGDVSLSAACGGPVEANSIGYVPQRNTVDWDFPTSVFDVVMMGTYGRLRWFQRPGKEQREETFAALEKVEMQDFARRQIGELSGGQQQRVFLARALVQNPSVYLMDEPFAGVDAKTEHALFEIMSRLREEDATVVMVHHDLTRVQQYFDHVVMLNRRLVASGPTRSTFSSASIEACYGVAGQSLVTTAC